MLRTRLPAVLSFVLGISGVSAAQQQTVPVEPRDRNITITGCVVKGDDGGFLLTNVLQQTTTSTTLTTPTGTAAVTTATTRPARMLYWLDDDDELEGHSGHKVEVTGELEGEIAKGEIEIEREKGMVKVEAKSDGKKVVARFAEVPAAIGTSGVVGDKEIEIDYLVRKIDVKSVRMLADNCR